MTDIKWQEPDALPRGTQRDWQAIFRALRERPGAWALVAADASPSTVQQINRGAYGGSSAGEFEAVSQKSATGTRSDIYARYVDGVSA